MSCCQQKAHKHAGFLRIRIKKDFGNHSRTKCREKNPPLDCQNQNSQFCALFCLFSFLLFKSSFLSSWYALEFLQPLHPHLSPLGVTRKVQNSTFHQQGLITSGFRGATVTRDKTNRCTSDTSFSLSLSFSLPPFLSLHLLHFVCGWADQQTGPLIGRAQTAAGVTRATAVQLLVKKSQ